MVFIKDKIKDKYIFCSNDDGYDSKGLLNVIDSVKVLGNIFAVAPLTQQSGKGNSATYFSPMKLKKRTDEDGVELFSLDGTPTDCVNVGLDLLKKESIKPDLLIAGINLGLNLGYERIFSSGTFCLALEGLINGIPPIAFSIEIPKDGSVFTSFNEDFDFSFAMKVVKRVSEFVLKNSSKYMEDKVLFNVNIPLDPVDDDIVFTNMDSRRYYPQIDKISDDEIMWKDGDFVYCYEKGTDANIVKFKKQVSISPVKFDINRLKYSFDVYELGIMQRGI